MTKMPEPKYLYPKLFRKERPYYTEDQIKQYGRDLLEEAAVECEKPHPYFSDRRTTSEITEAIRALKEQIK